MICGLPSQKYGEESEVTIDGKLLSRYKNLLETTDLQRSYQEFIRFFSLPADRIGRSAAGLQIPERYCCERHGLQLFFLYPATAAGQRLKVCGGVRPCFLSAGNLDFRL